MISYKNSVRKIKGLVPENVSLSGVTTEGQIIGNIILV